MRGDVMCGSAIRATVSPPTAMQRSVVGQDSPVRQALIDPLSERELDVLRLLGTDLNGPAIARELMVSLNTVRTHTKNIYVKLAVTSRRAAVRRGTELGLSRSNRQP